MNNAKHTQKCYGRFSGTEQGWMMFEDSAGNVWEEKSSEWEEVVYLAHGFFEYRHKTTGRTVAGVQ